ncbi:MAG: HipA domain-containing protein [Luteolibacter sp.]
MPYCPITLEPIAGGETFSKAGLRSLHPRLTRLAPLELTHDEQLRQARLRAGKMSIQGVQPKLSAVLRLKEGKFEITDTGGRFILKPNPFPYHDVPANESLTMTMAAAAGIDVPPHGLIPTADGGWIYVIRRFDREGRRKRIPVEDFAQLSGATRETKYDSSLERVATVVEEFCTFPAIEKPKLARRLLFCFLTGNEDMHLKNFSVIVRDQVVTLAPAYDLLNTTLVLEQAAEESALPLDGRKKNLSRKLWLDYFCTGRLGLPDRQVGAILDDFRRALPAWHDLIDRSHLPEAKKDAYHQLLDERSARLAIGPENS